MNVAYYRLCSLFSRSGAPKLYYQVIQKPSIFTRNMSLATKDIDDDLKSNPYYEKYANKIHVLQQTSPEDFKSRMEECKSTKAQPKFGSSKERGYSSVSRPKESSHLCGGDYKAKALNDIMKTELIQDMPAGEISKIWKSYFKDKDAIAASIPSDTYSAMFEKGKKYPLFILPLPRGQGYEFFLCQVQGQEVHLTSLINYQAHKENAPECLTMIHYTELENKGIVLMHGEYNKDVLDAREAQCLANQFQLYYGKDNEKRTKLLERLNYNPNDFKHMDLIAELECLSL